MNGGEDESRFRITERRPALRPPRRRSWQYVFQTGFWLWVLSVVVTALTDNANMIPTVVLLGSFLVPVTAVVWYLDHYERRTISVRLVLEALLVGGVLGVLAASVLESWLLRDGLLAYLGVGLVEELAKLLALMFVARRLTRYTVRDGVVLGAAVGFGFAALESSGYALTALVVRAGPFVELSLGNLVLTELLRGLLAPVGHGLWTAILGGVLFSSSLLGKLRVTGQVVAAYLSVAVLHALWDSMRAIAIVITAVLTETPSQRTAIALGERVLPTKAQVFTFAFVELAGLALISIVGFLWLWLTWRSGAGETPTEPHPEQRRPRPPHERAPRIPIGGLGEAH